MDTRKEELLKGNIDIEPETRKEMFIKHIYDKSQPVPEPETRCEHFLLKAAETRPEVEELTVTENGTYKERGKAFNPVNVNVEGPRLIEKVIRSNGIYNPKDDGADGYSKLIIDIPFIEEGQNLSQ